MSEVGYFIFSTLLDLTDFIHTYKLFAYTFGKTKVSEVEWNARFVVGINMFCGFIRFRFFDLLLLVVIIEDFFLWLRIFSTTKNRIALSVLFCPSP